MKLVLVCPFQTALHLDRKWIAYSLAEIREYFGRVEPYFAKMGIILGHCHLPVDDRAGLFLGIEDPGQSLRMPFIAYKKFDISLSETVLHNLCSMLTAESPIEGGVHVHWFGRGFACMKIVLNVSDAILDQDFPMDRESFDESLNGVARFIFKTILEDLKFTVSKLTELYYIREPDEADVSWSGEGYISVAENLDWVHKVWMLGSDVSLDGLPNFVSDSTARLVQEGVGNTSPKIYWGWGDSCAVGDDVGEVSWYHGMLLAQYLHGCLDKALRDLPRIIEKVRLLLVQGHGEAAQELGESFLHRAHMLLFELDFARNMTGGTTRSSLLSLFEVWQTPNLSESVVRGLEYVKAVNKHVGEKIRLWAQNSIELILFSSAVVAVFGLAISLHDYLSPDKSRFGVRKLKLPGTDDPITLAILLFVVSLFIFASAKLGYIAKVTMFAGFAWQRAVKTLRRRIRSGKLDPRKLHSSNSS